MRLMLRLIRVSIKAVIGLTFLMLLWIEIDSLMPSEFERAQAAGFQSVIRYREALDMGASTRQEYEAMLRQRRPGDQDEHD